VTRLGEILLCDLIIKDLCNFFTRKYGLWCVFLESRKGLMLIFFTFKLNFDENILVFFSFEIVWGFFLRLGPFFPNLMVTVAIDIK
jgi:hypothetical protein